ncbi:microtubule-associated protein 1A-like [Alligator sinensis]|uniref:Microtubule-associated protein 1A-like n=1 Tax=Alligator sinensis TaxID=38654 RepID=A0A3Q0HFT0_ALLSI|nr:microtubule-associated protein 1A-like [Alligator sinensis]
MSLAGWLLPAALQPSGVVSSSSSSCTNALLKTSSRQPPSLFFVLAPFPPPDLAAGAAVQTHIIKPGLAGNVAESQQEDVRSGVPAGERSDPVGSPAQPGLIRRRESQQHRAMDSPGNTARIARKTRTPQGGGGKGAGLESPGGEATRRSRGPGWSAQRPSAPAFPLPPQPRCWPLALTSTPGPVPLSQHKLFWEPGPSLSPALAGAEGRGAPCLSVWPGRFKAVVLEGSSAAFLVPTASPRLLETRRHPKAFQKTKMSKDSCKAPGMEMSSPTSSPPPSLPGIWMICNNKGQSGSSLIYWE